MPVSRLPTCSVVPGSASTQSVKTITRRWHCCGKVDASLAKDLSTLLAMKTSAGYSDVPVTGTKKKRAGRAMARLLDAATQEV